jgi:hypothetical protein
MIKKRIIIVYVRLKKIFLRIEKYRKSFNSILDSIKKISQIYD